MVLASETDGLLLPTRESQPPQNCLVAPSLAANEQLAGSLAALNVHVSTRNLRQRVHVMYHDIKFPGCHKREQLPRIRLQVLPFSNVAIQDRTHKLDVFGAQFEDVDGRYSAGL